VPRWDADAESRLLRAAMELFLAQGYDQVTVADIAERAGLKKRSFFRYFPDKREVLFGGSAAFQDAVTAGVLDAPPTLPALDAVVAALADAGEDLTAWGEPVRLRQQVIDSSAELREREVTKLATLAARVAQVLRQRGTDELTAALTARAGVAVFVTAFERWVSQPAPANFRELSAEALDGLRSAVRQASGGSPRRPPQGRSAPRSKGY
jgi:AcrR family transcriptional regulator